MSKFSTMKNTLGFARKKMIILYTIFIKREKKILTPDENHACQAVH